MQDDPIPDPAGRAGGKAIYFPGYWISFYFISYQFWIWFCQT
jgi:hypothetical protein